MRKLSLNEQKKVAGGSTDVAELLERFRRRGYQPPLTRLPYIPRL